jgi:AhpD family alkylhydroperoxidase
VPRLPLLPTEPDDPVTAAVYETFRAEDRDPIALYRVLAHSPTMLRAYAGLARGLRYEAATPRALRELMILRTAQVTASDYEWAQHRGMAAAAGVSEQRVAALAGWRESDLFDERERAALRAVDEMHAIALSDEAFAALVAATSPGEAVELVLLAAFYQAVSRMIQAFGLTVEPEYQRYLDREAMSASTPAPSAPRGR